MLGTCALCRSEQVELRDSHLLPSWAYKRVRATRAGGPDPNPVNFTEGKAFQTSKQITGFLLCSACEDRFGRRENYVSQLCRQSDGTTPLIQHLRRRADQVDKPLEVAELDIKVDAENLAYFAVSVVWRGDVMKEGHLASDVTLGDRYREKFRGYLNGDAAFPLCARVLLNVLKPPSWMMVIDGAVTTPSSNRMGACHRHAFLMCGFEFNVLVGHVLPNASEEACLVHSTTKRVVLLVPEMSALAKGVVEAGGKAAPTKALAARRNRQER